MHTSIDGILQAKAAYENGDLTFWNMLVEWCEAQEDPEKASNKIRTIWHSFDY